MKKVILLVFSLLGLLLSKSLFIEKNVVISFNQQASKDIEYQVFYTTDKNKDFNEDESVKKLVNKQDNNVKIVLPQKKIKGLRIDFGVVPGTVKISNLKIEDKNLDVNKFIKNEQIQSMHIDNDFCILVSHNADPFIVYQSELPKHSFIKINYLTLILLLFFWSMISYMIVSFVSNKENKCDAVFIIIFGILLFIPMLHISNDEKSLTENRMLATKPELITGDVINEKYGPDFNDFFQDRFFGRTYFIKLYSFIKDSLSFSGNERVLIGKKRWLFYKGDNSLDNFQNKNLFSDEELQNIALYLSDINDWAMKHGKTFYYIIAPDKNKIYGENITILKKLRPDSESRANQLVKYLQKNTKVKVLYPQNVLLKNKDKGLLYYKNDTHWTTLGAYFEYMEFIKLIQQHYKHVVPIVYDKTYFSVNENGDLTAMLGTVGRKDPTKYKLPIIKDSYECVYNDKDKDERKGFTCNNKDNKLKIFILRDSFTGALKPYLNNTFQTVKYEWRYDITKEDLKYIKNNSDIIVLEQVERYIPALSNLKFPKD